MYCFSVLLLTPIEGFLVNKLCGLVNVQPDVRGLEVLGREWG